MHPLGSPFVRDQLALRALPMNEKRTQPEGELVLYWMQTTQRIEENWALRLATLEADRLGRPLAIVQELTCDEEHASDRFHRFVLEGARETARRAAHAGLHCFFHLRERRGEGTAAIERVARRACLVVTDLFPTGGVRERSLQFAAGAWCRVVAVDSVGVVPASTFPREEFAARTIRPKLDGLRELSLERVEDRPPRRPLGAALQRSLEIDWLDVAHLSDSQLDHAIARCDIDHRVQPVPTRGGLSAARARLCSFMVDGLEGYSERRLDPSDDGGSSQLSPYLHYGQISAADVARAVTAARGAEQTDETSAFLNEMLTWRELSLNFCFHNAVYRTLAALPAWVQRSMNRHQRDAREITYTREELERGDTHDELWNAGQRQLVVAGRMHNYVRMLWGKSVLLWSATYAEALATLVYLNDRYALDGRDPNSYAGIQWCFGKFDRPFATRPVWGSIRPMSLDRAKRKAGVARYLTKWRQGTEVLELGL